MNSCKYNFFEKFFNNNKAIININIGVSILAKILKVKKKTILLEANLKSLIKIKNIYFLKKDNFKLLEGKYIKISLESLDNGTGTPKCSKENYFSNVFCSYIKFYLKNSLIISGILINKIKGGFFILLNNIKCFLPFSEVDKRILLNYFYYKGKNLKFNIISYNFKKQNIILSRKSLIYNHFYSRKLSLIKILKTGYIVKGVVKGISSYGIYIDLGYIDGLILSKNITWGPYKYANEVIEINKGIYAKILKIDRWKNRVYLGMKQIYENPWKNIYIKYKIGQLRYVRVFRITSDNIYIVFEIGVFGFLKKSILLKNKINDEFLNTVKVNNYILVSINYINTKKRFIGVKLFYKSKRVKLIKKIIKIKTKNKFYKNRL